MRLYEGLFLLDADAKPDPGHEAFLLDLLKKQGAEVVEVDRWGERKLSYDIAGKRRGLYFLVHFKAEPGTVAEIRRACRLAEPVLRELILVDEDGAAKTRADRVLGGSAAPPAV